MDNQMHTDERSKMIFSPKRISLTNQTLKKIGRETVLKVAREKRGRS